MRSTRLHARATTARFDAAVFRAWLALPTLPKLYRALFADEARRFEARADQLDAEAGRWGSGWRRLVP